MCNFIEKRTTSFEKNGSLIDIVQVILTINSTLHGCNLSVWALGVVAPDVGTLDRVLSFESLYTQYFSSNILHHR